MSRHGEAIRSFSVVLPGELPAARLEDWLASFCEWAGERLLRLKGVLALRERGQPQVVHAVQHRAYLLQELPQWPWPGREGRLVLITRDLDPDDVWVRLRELDEAVRPA